MGCSVADCGHPVKARGLCRRHYVEARAAAAPICSAPGCDRPVMCRHLCRGHYARSQRGVPLVGVLREFARGNRILSVRLNAGALERLRERAQDAGLTANKFAAKLLVELLGHSV